MPKALSDAAREALAATDWTRIDAMDDADIARQITSNRDAAPDMARETDGRKVRRATPSPTAHSGSGTLT